MATKIPQCNTVWYTETMPKRRYKSKYDKQIPQWIRYYNSGKSAQAVARKFGVDLKVVTYQFRAKGVRVKPTSEVVKSDNNSQWAGDNVSYGSLHQWVKRRLPKPKLCSSCNERPALDLANISPNSDADTYTRDLENWKWICRKCHMVEDGRITNLVQYRG